MSRRMRRRSMAGDDEQLLPGAVDDPLAASQLSATSASRSWSGDHPARLTSSKEKSSPVGRSVDVEGMHEDNVSLVLLEKRVKRIEKTMEKKFAEVIEGIHKLQNQQ